MAYNQKKFGGFGNLVQNLSKLKGSKDKMTPREIGSAINTIKSGMPNMKNKIKSAFSDFNPFSKYR